LNVDLFLIRHAEAVALPEAGNGHDEDRPLTEAGHAQVGVLAKALHQRGLHLTPVASSPLVRARQTAEGLLHAWGRPTTELLECPELTPGTRRRKLAKYLTRLQAEAVALVGHQPNLGAFGAWLIGSKKAQLDIAKGGAAYIRCEGEFDRGTGELVWMVTPEWCGLPAAVEA
jgi:phosphohistidine phosphatase